MSIAQPYSDRELWLFECERTPIGRTYRVTRNGWTTTWSESLVRHFLVLHHYRNPDVWLSTFGAEGSLTSFGWVREKQGGRHAR